MGGQACVFYGAAQVSEDRIYWEPLKRDMEAFRRDERSKNV
jgi:hypothetical protein